MEILCSILHHVGHTTAASCSGLDGIERAKEFSPDIIFCDIGLPGLNGFEVAKRIRKEESLKNVFMIALTGYAGEREIEFASRSGFNLHLSKPINMEIIKDVLNKIPNITG